MKSIQTIGFTISLALLTSCASSPQPSSQSSYRPPAASSSSHSWGTQIWFQKGADQNKILEIVTAVFKNHGYELHPSPARTMTVLTFIGNGKAEASTEVTKVDPFKLETDYQKPVQEFGPYEWQYNVSVGRAGPVDSPEVIVEIQMHQSGEIMGVKTETVESTSYYPEQQIIIKEIKDKLKALGWYDNRFD